MAVDSDCIWEALDHRSERNVGIHTAKMATFTHLIAVAAALDPNYPPTSFRSSFPAKAILCTLGGHRIDGESKNHVKIWT